MGRRPQDKVKLTLSVNKNVLARAKEIIPNLSSFVEMKLREAVILAEHGLNVTPGVGFEPTRAEPSGLAVLETEISTKDLEQYLQMHKNEWSVRHYDMTEWVLKKFIETVNGKISTKTILEYINSIQQYAKRKDYANTVIRFLKWIEQVHKLDLSHEIGLLKEVKRPQKVKKLYADSERFTLTLEEIRKTVDNLIKKDNYRLASLIVLLASTGLRPEEACTVRVKGVVEPGITRDMIDLEKGYFILPSHMSKTRVERVIPLHPDFCELYPYFIKRWKRDELWRYDTFPKIVRTTPVKKLSRLRKFFVIHSAEIGFPEHYRIAIAGHDEEDLLKLRVTNEFYRKFTPEKIVEEYMKYWRKVKFLNVRATRK